MHPGFMSWWKNHSEGDGCGARAGGDGREGGDPREWARRHFGGPMHEGGGFGVRRPLRFLAYKLELDEKQVAELARILNELKTERAQAEVDGRRTIAAFADAVSAAEFDRAKAAEAGALRVQSAERLRDAVAKALGEIHGLLNAEQRSTLAYLIRTGTVSL